MFSEQSVFKINSKEVYCEGEGDSVGHPRVFLNMGELFEITCPYCSKKYIYASEK